jgi:threonine synthase
VDFSVPSGNFGNICASHIARMMGLPIRRLILATNENNVLDEFFRTGVYRPRGREETRQTSSPSMDISKASNFERFVYDLLDRDGVKLSALWRQFETEGMFDLSGTPAFSKDFGFVSGASTHADRVTTIRTVSQRYGVVVDPHTADGIKVGLEHRADGVPLICLETALPVKFADTIREALGRDPECPARFVDLPGLPQRFTVMDPEVDGVKAHVAHYAPECGS